MISSKLLRAACALLLWTVPASANSLAASPEPLRPPNGTYEYSLTDGGSIIFKSIIVIEGSNSAFSVSETTKLPNGAIATTKSTWLSDTLMPQTFEVHQGTVLVRAHITHVALTLDDGRASFARIPGTRYILPSVGLIATTLMYPYVVLAHPSEPFTLAEIQNNQTVLVRPDKGASAGGPFGDSAVSVFKEQEHGKTADIERIVTWLSNRTGIMDAAQVVPGGAKITLISFKPQ